MKAITVSLKDFFLKAYLYSHVLRSVCFSSFLPERRNVRCLSKISNAVTLLRFRCLRLAGSLFKTKMAEF